jgi:hypothetical protein
MELKKLKVQAEVMWAFLDKPNELSGKYQVDLCNLSKDAAKALTEMGVSVRKREDQPEKGFFVTAKSSNYPIKTVDMDGNVINGIKVANGSKAVALLAPYEYTYQKKKGVAVGIDKLIITDLKIYESDVEVDETEDVL